MDQIDYDLTEFANDIFVCEHQVTGQEGSSVKVMNCLPHIYAMYKEVKNEVLHAQEENIILQVLEEFV